MSPGFQRVKVYRLNEDGKWDDQGTGHVTVDYLEVLLPYFSLPCFSWHDGCILYFFWTLFLVVQRSEDLGLFVIDEEDNETLLLHRISSDDIYRKQEGVLFWIVLLSFINFIILVLFPSISFILHFIFSDTIISWRDPEFSTELALSFQETTGCSYIWLVSTLLWFKATSF